MSKSRRSSSVSATPEAGVCRLQWRPSRLPTIALWLMVALAPLSVLASDLPRGWAWPLALAATVYAVRQARRYAAQPALALVLPACGGTTVRHLRVEWRGPLARLEWSDPDGVRQRRLFWPDTLDARARRELRLAMMRREPAPDARSVAG